MFNLNEINYGRTPAVAIRDFSTRNIFISIFSMFSQGILVFGADYFASISISEMESTICERSLRILNVYFLLKPMLYSIIYLFFTSASRATLCFVFKQLRVMQILCCEYCNVIQLNILILGNENLTFHLICLTVLKITHTIKKLYNKNIQI